MVESIFQTLLLLAYFDVALLSITIANYAVSVSYLGRESRLTRRRMDRKKERLLEKLRELRKTTQIESIKKEIGESEAEQRRLGIRISLLSWLGAVILPSMFFIVSFICAVIGMNMEILSQDLETQKILEQQFIMFSSGALVVGFTVLLFVIKTIDSAAGRIPIPEFEVSFENREKRIKLRRKEKAEIGFRIENKGEDIAEDMEIYVQFPPTFEIHEKGTYSVFKHDAQHHLRNYSYVWFREEILHIRTACFKYVEAKMPDEKETFEIFVSIGERKLGLSEYTLEIEISD